ncbi:hypothetical protein PHYSODRAFT_340607 [Phytophthora sojae]|uniref:Uncharacterized protein n=1 Tax=Phytophthora sojae (strain P6497) TaxID=1094619 RepID=G5AA99_PHYSP|nr:hypothetical protein PHYSODRAFT_340607 [Phytophthora sojae]EGZ07528.1 hypothetical protein PHYSODRAFT_340607 [Phytophthora sojae]|eukprot:XP_009537094.1 hypothetical protein PHYSODRAFT_340607 [Phytophthora sojae]
MAAAASADVGKHSGEPGHSVTASVAVAGRDSESCMTSMEAAGTASAVRRAWRRHGRQQHGEHSGGQSKDQQHGELGGGLGSDGRCGVWAPRCMALVFPVDRRGVGQDARERGARMPMRDGGDGVCGGSTEAATKLAMLLILTLAAAMLVMLLSLHARHDALAVPATATLAVTLRSGSPKCWPTVAHAAEIVQAGFELHFSHYPPRLFVIMRGLPGSGTTTFAQEVVRYAATVDFRASICSAGLFFQRGGSYVFDASRLWEAHRSCYEQCRELLWRSTDRGVDIVIVDNCNLRMDDFERYQDLHIPSDKLAYLNIWTHNAPEEPRPDNEVDTVNELHIDDELTTVNMPRAYIITLEEFMRDR